LLRFLLVLPLLKQTLYSQSQPPTATASLDGDLGREGAAR
jgi:hypothetical protein